VLLTITTITVVVCSAAVFFVATGTHDLPSMIGSDPDGEGYDYQQGIEIIPGEYREAVWNEITGDYRPVYPELTVEEYEWFFGELPSFPQNFFEVAELIYEGKFTDFSQLGPEYYLQPEFYPAWFGVFKNSSYVDYDPVWWTPEGYGCYPSIKEVTVSRDVGSFVVDTYLRTGYAVHAYQGLILEPILPESAVALDGTVLFDNPDNVDGVLSACIINEDDPLYLGFKESLAFDNVDKEDWLVVLKPTHGVLKDKYGEVLQETGFPDDWVRVLQLEISMDGDIPLGDYVVGVDVDTPCFSINQEYYYSTVHEFFGGLYYPAGQFHRTLTPHFQVVIHVI